MGRQIKASAANPDDLYSIPGLHMVQGENQRLRVVLWSPHMHVKV